MVAYVHIEYPAYQFSEESKGGWNPPTPPGPCGTEKSVVLRGLNEQKRDMVYFASPLPNTINTYFTPILLGLIHDLNT